jgi:CBS domain-containing protein
MTSKTRVGPRSATGGRGLPASIPRVRTRHHTQRVTVADVMTAPPESIESAAPVEEVLHRFLSGGTMELVVTSGTRPVGVITARDLLALLDPAPGAWQPRNAGALIATRASRLLPDLDISVAARVMSTDGVAAVAVVDLRGELIGVVARRHLIDRLVATTS